MIDADPARERLTFTLESPSSVDGAQYSYYTLPGSVDPHQRILTFRALSHRTLHVAIQLLIVWQILFLRLG